jgi:DMSO/TMAO reductase YedYZ molybdopterin-dependent catalytic subunit
LARWWHFSGDMFWLANGLLFYILLFSTHQWQRLVPTSWDVFPNALSMMLQYLSLQLPPENGWIRYNSLQQIAYFVTVFVAPGIAAFTGLMQSPAIANRFGFLAKVFNRQCSRSIHFLILLWYLQFIGVHITMVVVTGLRRNLNHITLGNDSLGLAGLVVASLLGCVVFAVWLSATPFTLKHARFIQKAGKCLVGGIKGLIETWDPETQYTEKDIAPFLWPNGIVPDSQEYKGICGDNYAGYRLRVTGLVEKPHEFSYAEILSMPKQEQITAHYCIQGWSGVAKWAGVPMRYLLDLVQPQPSARYAVFYSFGEGGHGGFYYDVHTVENMQHHASILAYEMNGSPLTTLYGAPLRLRCENELGFKMVKWIRAIELVDDFSTIGSGQGGYNEDHEFYGYRAPI